MAKLMGLSCQAVWDWIQGLRDCESLMPKPRYELVSIELAAFRRRSIVVTKSLKILESTLAVFPFHHINNDFLDLIKISIDF